MAVPIIDVASPILQAYFQGKQMRMQREEQLKRREVEQQRLQQDNEQFQQQQKRLMEQQKEATTHNQELLGIRKAEADLAAKRGNAAIRLDVLKAMRSGVMKAPTQAANYTEPNAPQIPAPYTIPETGETIDPSMFPEPEGTQMERVLKAQELRDKSQAERDSRTFENRLSLQNDAQLSAAERSNNTIAGALERTLAIIAGRNAGSPATPEEDPEAQEEIDNRILKGSMTMEQFNQTYSPKYRATEMKRLASKGIQPLTQKTVDELGAVEAARTIMEDVRSLANMATTLNNLDPSSDYNSRLKTIRARIATLRDSVFGKGLGVLSKPDLERMEGALPTQWDIMRGRAKEKIKAFVELHNMAAERGYRNLTPRQRAYWEHNRQAKVE